MVMRYQGINANIMSLGGIAIANGAMEDVLTVYKRSYRPNEPVPEGSIRIICMDETSKQLTKETRELIAARPGCPTRYDYEYECNGVCSLFMFYEPFAGKRYVSVTDRRTRLDWAMQIRDLLDVHYPAARKIILVMDNLNTHNGASLYETFPPEEARRLLDRLEIHYTPKHGSWLNIAEIELSVLARQCLDRRIPNKPTLTSEVSFCQQKRNMVEAKIDWRFTTADARVKLKRLYPMLSC